MATIYEDLEESNFALVPFETFLVVIAESDFNVARTLSGLILEGYLPDEEETIVKDDSV